jgi:D-alanyl-D-alanine carboxypeptidase
MTGMRAFAIPAVLAAVLALACAGCGGGTPSASPPSPSGPAASTPASTPSPPAPGGSPSAPASASPSPSRTHHRPRVFTASVSRVLSRSQVRYSWHPGCPVPVSGLRVITMTYRGFDHRVHTGRLVVNAAVTGKLIRVFRDLFRMRYPIRRMVPVDAYHGSDYGSIQADNTSAFNCRNATGSTSWSEHAYGLAIDLNPCENPYVAADGTESHRKCRVFVDRNLRRPGLIHAGDPVVQAFASVGWGWGGVWQGAVDYQHFSVNGR